MKKPTILVLAKTGFVLRDLVLGKFGEKISNQAFMVVALPSTSINGLMQSWKGNSISTIEFPEFGRNEHQIHRLLNLQHLIYRFKQIQRHNSSMEINTKLLKSHYSMTDSLITFSFMLLGYLVNLLNISEISDEIFLKLIGRWDVTKQWVYIIKEVKPDFVFSTILSLPDGFDYPSADLPPVLACLELGIPVGTLIQSWDNLSSKTYIMPKNLTRFWTWSENMSQDLIYYCNYIPIDRIKSVGSPHYDFHLDPSFIVTREKYLCSIGLDPNKKYVVIGTGTKSMFPDAPKSVNQLINQILDNIPTLQIVVRIHPKDDGSRWYEHLEQLHQRGIIFQNTNPDVHMDQGGFDPPSVYFHNLINLLFHSAIVINASSSLSVDAAIMNKPIITLCYDNEPDQRFPYGRNYSYNHSAHFLPLIRDNGIHPVYSLDDCIALIRKYLEAPTINQAARKKVSQYVGGSLDGLAGERLAVDLLNVVS